MNRELDDPAIAVKSPAPGDAAESLSSPPGDSPPASEPESVLGLNRGDRRVVTVLIVTALLLMGVQWYRLTQARPAPIDVLHPNGYQFELDVNRATWVEWMQLDGVGETLARRIVEDREQNGPFTSVNEVQRVKGIGPKTLEAIRPHLRCDLAADPPEGT